MLVIAGVLLMFVFVIGDPLMSYMGSSGGGGGGGQNARDVAVRWDGGKLTNAELGQLVMRRRIVNEFIQQVELMGRMAAFDTGRQPPPLRVEMLVLPERPDQNVEQDIVRMEVFADAARRIGMGISDEQVIRYLQQLGRGYVSTDHLREVIARLRVGGGASVDYILDALREEMLARNYLASHVFARDTVLPEQRWDDWLDVNDRVVVEAAAIPTERFLVDVPQPTDSELSEFFDEYKDREPRPDLVGGIEMPSPLPGFAIPRKVELQFVRADYELFLKQVTAEVTDEEIEKYYDENKDPYFIRAATDLLDRTIGETPVDAAAVESEENSVGDAELPADSIESDSDEASIGDAEPNGPESETEPEADAAPADDEQSSTDRSQRNVFRLAAFADEAEADTDATATDETSDQDETVSADEQSATASTATETAQPSEQPKEFQPLEEVRDQIRREIAQLKVSEQLESMMGKLESDLGAKYATYLGAVLDAEEMDKALPPPPPELADLTAVAESHGLEYQKTASISALELRELPVGLSHKPDEETVPFLYIAFGTDLELYQPVATFDTDNNRYLVMKTADTPGSVPKLDEIRDAVVSAWRRQQAAEIALKHAQAEAKKAESADSLADFFAADQRVTVTKTDPFSLYTAGTVSRQTGDVQSFRLNKPEGIEGADFNVMETIFGLDEGQVGAALNHDHSRAYLLRIVEHEQTPAELRQAFLSEADTWYGLSVMSRAHARQATQILLVDMMQSAGVDWLRDPDQPYREEE